MSLSFSQKPAENLENVDPEEVSQLSQESASLSFSQKADEAYDKYLQQIHRVRTAALLPLSTNKNNHSYQRHAAPALKQAHFSTQAAPPSTTNVVQKKPWWQRPDVYFQSGKDPLLGNMGGAVIDFRGGNKKIGNKEDKDSNDGDEKPPAIPNRRDV